MVLNMCSILLSSAVIQGYSVSVSWVLSDSAVLLMPNGIPYTWQGLLYPKPAMEPGWLELMVPASASQILGLQVYPTISVSNVVLIKCKSKMFR